MQYESVKKYLPVIIVGMVLVFINLFAVIWYFLPAGPDQWKDDIVPGKVVLITESGLVTSDPRGNTKTFVLTPETQYFAGRNIVASSTLVTDTIVLVQLDVSSTTALVAKEVRIMTDKRKVKKNP